MQRLLIAALLAATCGVAVRQASAQPRASITGTIGGEGGAKLSSVTITIDSPALPRRTLSTRTNDRGEYRLSNLPAGVYDLTASFQGRQTVKRPGLQLSFGTTVTVDLTLGAASEVLTMSGPGPMVDVTVAASTTQFSREDLENLPIAAVDGLLQLGPGITPRSAFGSGLDTNQIMVDGSPTVFTHGGGNVGVGVHPYWMDQAQVVSFGANAASGEFSGVLANVAIRSGTNRLSGLMEYRMTPRRGVADNTGSLPDELRAQFKPQEILTSWASNIQAGGPIVPDRLFFFSGFQYIRTKVVQAGTLGNVPRDLHWPNVLARFNGVASPNLRVEGFVQHERFHPQGVLDRNQLPETARDSSTRVSSWNGRVTWAATSQTIVEVRNTGLDYQFVGLPGERRLGPSPHFDSVTQILSGNAGNFADNVASHVLTGGSLRRFATDFSGRNHEIEVGVEYDRMKSRQALGFPGGRSYTDVRGVPTQVVLWNGDTVESSGARTTFFAQDVWRATRRLTLHAGVRAAINRGAVPGKGTVFRTNSVSPRLGVAWDVARDHRTVVRAGYGRFHEGLYPTVFDFLDTSRVNPRITARVLGPETFQELNRSPTVAVALDDQVAHAYVDQYLAGVERELFPSISLKAQYVRRNFREIWAFVDTGSRYAPVQRTDPGPDGQLGTSDDGASIGVFNLLNANQQFAVLTNPDEAFRRYDAVQVIGEKRLSHNWQLLAAYTWSRARGTVNIAGGEKRAGGTDTGRNGVFYNPNRSINAEGPSGPDVPHQLNVQGTYLLPAWGGVNVSGSYRYVAGGAWGRVAMIGLAQGNQGVRIEPRGTRRLDAYNQLDLRLEKTFPLGSPGWTAGIYVDVFNVTNQGVATNVQEGSGAAFGQPTQWTPPRTLQIAARIKF